MRPNNNSGRLRASCDRCRAHKLRCVPSSDTDLTAPCQRCLRAIPVGSCIFAPRSRTVRSRGSTGSKPVVSVETGEQPVPVPPSGLNIFAVEPPPSSEHSPSPYPSSADDSLKPIDPAVEVTAYAWEQEMVRFDSLCHDSASQDSPDLQFFGGGDSIFSAPIDNTYGSTPDKGGNYNPNSGGGLEFQDFLNTPSSAEFNLFNADSTAATVDKPGPLVDLSTLVAEMSTYQTQLSSSFGIELQNYPIGSAIFLSRRFHSVLIDCARDGLSAHLGTPTMLLALSCYIGLARIYLSVFTYLHDNLSRSFAAHSAQDHTRGLSSPWLQPGCGVQAYRGLRLVELLPVCMCADWHPAKKAVSMLVDLLANVETSLGLPSDLRTITTPQAGMQAGYPRVANGRAGPVLFGDALTSALTNGRICKTVRDQTRELRSKVEDIEELLNLKGLNRDLAHSL